MRLFVVLGDDFAGYNPWGEIFDMLMDGVFGTTTVTEMKPFFCTPDTGDGLEFLRRRFYLDKTEDCWNIMLHKDPVRTVAKLFKGSSVVKKEKFYAATMSALWEIGCNREIFNMLYAILTDLSDKVDESTTKTEFRAYLGKNPLLVDMVSGFIPTYDMILNLDRSLVIPALQVRKSLEAQKYGMTLAMMAAET